MTPRLFSVVQLLLIPGRGCQGRHELVAGQSVLPIGFMPCLMARLPWHRPLRCSFRADLAKGSCPATVLCTEIITSCGKAPFTNPRLPDAADCLCVPLEIRLPLDKVCNLHIHGMLPPRAMKRQPNGDAALGAFSSKFDVGGVQPTHTCYHMAPW